MMISVVASVDIKKNVKIFIRVFIGCLSVIQELPLVEVGDCYFVKTMFSLKHRSHA